jgi:hypothetical protein
MRKLLIKKLGGFVDIDDAINSIESKEDKHKILTLAVKDLYNTLTKDDILTEEKGVWFSSGKPINSQIQKVLVAEAENFKNSRLWAILQGDIKYQANKKMYIDSVSIDDLITGKLWLLTLDTFKTRLDSLQKGSGKFNTTA